MRHMDAPPARHQTMAASNRRVLQQCLLTASLLRKLLRHQRKSKRVTTIDILTKLIETCGQSLVDIRDKAILLVAFASGGRRRSEIASLRMSQLTREADVLIDARDAGKGTMPCARIRLGRTKTTTNDEGDYALIMGRPVVALYQWTEPARIDKGAIFRSIDRWGNINNVALTGQSINNMIKSRVKKAGLDPNDFSAHALRAGYLTEAARKGYRFPKPCSNQAINQYSRQHVIIMTVSADQA